LTALSYIAITPARDEVHNLPRLAESLAQQAVRPARWIVVDDGSTDGTGELVAELSHELGFVELATIERESGIVRGQPVVEAFERGLASVASLPDVVVKLDADTSFGREYFGRLLERFDRDPSLGIASGTCFELDPDDVWRERPMVGDNAWGATRAYRTACLNAVLPLERAMGWDGVDAVKAVMAGWRVATFDDFGFRHHRLEGERDGSRWTAWSAQGRASHYMGYAPLYIVLRALHNARREPAALALVSGYASALVRRADTVSDPAVRRHLRRSQSLFGLAARFRQATRATRTAG
jgi:biofilm PGA synthesis N-glycosyltransferase PgaC